MRRKLVALLALMAALLVQLTIVNGLALPGGGTPDLVLLCVIAVGMTGGPSYGVVAGFCAGLALDLAPPASQLVGQYALVLCLVGYGAGRLRFALQHSALLALVSAAALAAAGETLSALLTLVLDTPEVTWSTVAAVLPPSVLYDIVLGPVILLCAVRLAVALGTSFDPQDDSPALESGGSAAPVTVAGLSGVPGVAAMNAAGHVQRSRLRVNGGDSRAAASGRWLVGDLTGDAPAMGAIGWLGGPARSRRARREQARLTATITGATPRRGASWVGRRPPGLLQLTPVTPPKTLGLARFRPEAGVAGSAAARPAATYESRFGRPVRLGLADEQRRRARSASKQARGKGQLAYGATRHGLDRHGLNGPDVPRIAFGATGRGGGSHRAGQGAGHGSSRPAAGRTPRIAFGTGSLAATGRAAARPVPRIAFRGSGPHQGKAGQLCARGGANRVGGATAGGSRGSRRTKQPHFARSAATHQTRARRPKTARISPRRGVLGWLAPRRAGGRSAVWRIGSRRMGGFR
jgi:rod shape-determining protein MreD